MSNSASEPPLVSVIMPAFNAEQYIERAIESALGQTFDRLELIVVDDGSTDGTWDIIRRIARTDRRVIPIQQANAGVAAARNLAIDHARGTFLAPLDADDLWMPSKLEKQVDEAQRGGESVGMVYAWWLSIDEADTVRGRAGQWQIVGQVTDALLFVNFIGNASVPLYRTSTVRDVGGYSEEFLAQEGQGCEDWDLSLRVAKCSDVGVVQEYLVGYRGPTAGETMSCDTVSMAKSYELTLQETLRSHAPFQPHLTRWSESRFYAYLTTKSYSAGDIRHALQWLQRAFDADACFWFSFWALRLAAKIRLRLWLSPVSSLIWPDHQSWLTFRKRFRFKLFPGDEIYFYAFDRVESSKQAAGWRWWVPYECIQKWRWSLLCQQTDSTATAAAHESLVAKDTHALAQE